MIKQPHFRFDGRVVFLLPKHYPRFYQPYCYFILKLIPPYGQYVLHNTFTATSKNEMNRSSPKPLPSPVSFLNLSVAFMESFLFLFVFT